METGTKSEGDGKYALERRGGGAQVGRVGTSFAMYQLPGRRGPVLLKGKRS